MNHPVSIATAKRALAPRGSAAKSADVFDVHGLDKAAVEDWIRSKTGASDNSIRAYRQAVRSLWEWLARRRNGETEDDMLIGLRTNEAHAYVQDQLNAGLAARTLRQRMSILNSMYLYWVTPRDGVKPIKDFNPFLGILSKVPDVDAGNMGARKSLTHEEQEYVERALNAMPRKTELQIRSYWRARVVWLLASRLALRRAEISALRVNDFRISSNGADWKIEIRGKGRHASQDADVVMVPAFIVEDIRHYRKSMGLYPDLLPSDAGTLIRPVTGGERFPKLSNEHVAKIMKSIFRAAAEIAERELATHSAWRLKQASIHWGRHTWFMNALETHDIRLVSRAGRHKQIETTMKSYVGTTEKDLARVMGSGKPFRNTLPSR